MSQNPPSRKQRRERDARRRLADPDTYAALEAAQQEGRARYGARLAAIGEEMKALLAGRILRDLTGADAVAFMALHALMTAARR